MEGHTPTNRNGRKGANAVIIAALAAGRTISAAAIVSGISQTTIKRRLKDPKFAQALNNARAQFLSRAMGRLANDSVAAAHTLRRLLHAESEAVRLGAARAILELGTRLREVVELEQRIAALEARP